MSIPGHPAGFQTDGTVLAASHDHIQVHAVAFVRRVAAQMPEQVDFLASVFGDVVQDPLPKVARQKVGADSGDFLESVCHKIAQVADDQIPCPNQRENVASKNFTDTAPHRDGASREISIKA